LEIIVHAYKQNITVGTIHLLNLILFLIDPHMICSYGYGSTMNWNTGAKMAPH
jgi:hypothetical protein